MKPPGIDSIVRIDRRTGRAERIGFDDLPDEVRANVLDDLLERSRRASVETVGRVVEEAGEELWEIYTKADDAGVRYIAAVIAGMRVIGESEEDCEEMVKRLSTLIAASRSAIRRRLEEAGSYRIDEEASE